MRRLYEPPSPDRDPRPMPVQATPQIVSELAPTGVLRAAINMGNFLLVTGKCPNGDPSGVSPDMAAAIAARLGVPVKFIPYARPGEIADDAEKGAWDIGNIGAEPQRAAVINFTAAYCEIEATYLVAAGSPIRSVSEVDQPGKRVAVTARSAYGLWLENNFKKGELLQFDSAEAAIKAFTDQKMDAYAGLRPGLIDVTAKLPGSAGGGDGGRHGGGGLRPPRQARGKSSSGSARHGMSSEILPPPPRCARHLPRAAGEEPPLRSVRDGPAVEVPRGMPQGRHHDDEAEE